MYRFGDAVRRWKALDTGRAAMVPHVPGGLAEVVAGTTDPFVAQLADVVGAIRDRRAPAVPLADGAATLRLALAARRAADEGGELRLT